MQKIARCNYVAYLWKHADMRDPLENMQPTDHDWEEVDGVYLPIWFTGRQMPAVLSKTLEPEDDTDAEENDCEEIDNFTDDESDDERESHEDGE